MWEILALGILIVGIIVVVRKIVTRKARIHVKGDTFVCESCGDKDCSCDKL